MKIQDKNLNETNKYINNIHTNAKPTNLENLAKLLVSKTELEILAILKDKLGDSDPDPSNDPTTSNTKLQTSSTTTLPESQQQLQASAISQQSQQLRSKQTIINHNHLTQTRQRHQQQPYRYYYNKGPYNSHKQFHYHRSMRTHTMLYQPNHGAWHTGAPPFPALARNIYGYY
ncbi:hypothetical protein DPMN_082627 [Dreissena polymorpha]|uniref:Uncharacterized protein n=1 Tax=Dreissena polymorpha TaxID=45954 RepID=A0A9D3YAE2_DREPO|nr:hypothetical protein DPMN_082627 [Dreissena polymorpha]